MDQSIYPESVVTQVGASIGANPLTGEAAASIWAPVVPTLIRNNEAIRGI